MSWLTILLMIFRYGPTVWALVKEIIKLIEGLGDENEKQMAMAELSDITTAYMTTKDKRPLEALRERLRARRQGK